MFDKTSWKGIYPALLTPFTADGTVNEEALRRLIRLNLDKGVQGFYATGSTAEAFMLSVDERKRILEIVLDEVRGQAKVIAQVGTISQAQAVDMARHAQKAGADMISSIPPFYYGFSFSQIKSYYMALADSVDLPVLIYHFPASSGVQMTVDNVDEFLQDSRFAGIKYTSSDFFMMQQLRQRHPEALILNGYDELFLCGLAMGADGGVGSTYNFMAEKFIALMRLFHEGKIEEAQKVQAQANKIIIELIRVGVMPGEKAALDAMGISMGDCLKPLPTVSADNRASLIRIMRENGCQV